ncbi:MAG TPA: hypothetical protein VLX92_16660 [Kofleriaceae bacterium]|nr:hypothetical protein [Kofleriaceae bacterium]
MRRCALAALAACTYGAPGGFSPGTSWTFPLVDPLDDGPLITAVYVDGRGPFPCALDPDSGGSFLDAEVLARAAVEPHGGSARIEQLRLGTLVVSEDDVRAAPKGAFDTPNRRVYGVIGRDVIAESLVFGFDRDRGIAWLTTVRAFHPPAGALVVPFETEARDDLPPWRYVEARVNGVIVQLHLDLANLPSQLKRGEWPRAHLDPVPRQLVVCDAPDRCRDVDTGAVAASVSTYGPISRGPIGFVPFGDDEADIDGTLGLDFFQPYAVAADWDHRRYYLSPRHADAGKLAVRLARWGAVIPPPCARDGCLALYVDDRGVAHAARDRQAPGVPLEALYDATAADGTPLPRLHVSLPATVDTAIGLSDPRYGGAHLALVDVSPLPLDCKVGCIESERVVR